MYTGCFLQGFAALCTKKTGDETEQSCPLGLQKCEIFYPFFSVLEIVVFNQEFKIRGEVEWKQLSKDWMLSSV